LRNKKPNTQKMKIETILTTVVLIYVSALNAAENNFKLNSSFFSSAAKAEAIKKEFNSGSFSSQSVSFTENKGQVYGFDGLPHPEVKFVFQQGSTKIFLLEKGIAYQFTKTHYPEGYQELMRDKKGIKDFEQVRNLKKQIRTETFRMDMTLVGANNQAEITSEGKSIDYTNFYNRNVLNVHQYNKITYHEIYPGIDWVIYTNNGEIKYDFVVHPGAKPSLIKMEFTHQEELKLNADGSFTLKNILGSVTEKKPVSFQGEQEIKTAFVLNGNVLTFSLNKYNAQETLVVDPSVLWATYYGGSSDEAGNSCATDAIGNVYLAGYTDSNFGIASAGHQNTFGGYYDAFLVKFNSAGLRLWATYYGNVGDESAQSCTTDAMGNIYLAGYSDSNTGIASGGHQNTIGGNIDAFLVKFNSAGVRIWATYYGGIGEEWAQCCVTDPFGNVYMTGYTSSNSAIASGGHQNTFGGIYDAFLVKFDNAGVRLWATYYGGSLTDGAFSCATDAAGNIYMAGNTQSNSGIASGGHQNIFGGGFEDSYLVKFDNTGLMLWATYCGGSGEDWGQSCATDALGNVYLAGVTDSNLGIASGGHQNTLAGTYDAFLVKFDSAGIRLWSTYYGGSFLDGGFSCATDVVGNVYLAGVTDSNSGIASIGYQHTKGGLDDAFLAKFNNSGMRLWAIYFGGSLIDGAFACATDANGNVYLAGATDSNSGIASAGHQINFGGGSQDAFLVKFCVDVPEQSSAISGNTVTCASISSYYSVGAVTAATGYSWSTPSSWVTVSLSNSIVVIPNTSGTLGVAATNTCGAGPMQTISIVVNPSPTISVNSGTICMGESFTLSASGANTYTYSGGSNIVSPTINTNYSVTGTSTAGCISATAAVSSLVVDACTGIFDSYAQVEDLKVYPNPNTGFFAIESDKESEMQIFNSLGQLIIHEKIKAGINNVNLLQFDRGIYFIRVSGHDTPMIVKVIKQ